MLDYFQGVKVLGRQWIIFAICSFVSMSCRQPAFTPVLLIEDSIKIQQLKTEARRFFLVNPDSFSVIQFEIAKRYKHAERLTNWLNCYDTIIFSYRKRESYDKMLAAYERLYKELWREPADSSALVILAESNRQIARYYYRTVENYELALKFYDEGIKLMTRAKAWNPETARIFFKAAGNCASRMDDYQKSISYSEHNVQVCRDWNDTINLWQALNDLSYPYMQAGKFDKAKSILCEGYELVRNSDSVEQKIDVCSSFADMFTQMNQLDSATKYLSLCLTYLRQWKNKEPDSESDIYRQQGQVLSLQKNFGAAEKSYLRAVELMKNSTEGRTRECGKILGEFGNMYVKAGQENKALEKFHESLECLIPDFKDHDVNAMPDASLLYDENGIFITCEGRGDAYINRFSKTNKVKDLKYAALNYQCAQEILNKRNKSIQSEASRILFDESVRSITIKYIRTDSLLQSILSR